MKARYAFTICAFVTAAVLVATRHHIRDLSEVIRTYATFHRYIRNHPEVLYRYASPNGSSIPTTHSIDLPPKIIHQIYLTPSPSTTVPEKYLPAIQSCTTLHPEWTYHLWTTHKAEAFISTTYPSLLPIYLSYPQTIQRANILRYALLHHYGGTYLDLDISCRVPLDSLVVSTIDFLSPGAYPAGVNNAFLLSKPRHKFLEDLLWKVEEKNLKWGLPYVENMLSTGCMFFSNRWVEYVGKGGMGSGKDRVAILADGRGELEGHMLRGYVETPLFVHGGASSWHGWDAAAIVMVGEHYVLVLVVAGLVGVMSGYLMWKMITRHRGGAGKRLLAGAVRTLRESTDKRRDDEERLLG